MRSRLASEEQGFTLLELLVVVVIIGILAAIALALFTSQKEKGQDADAKSNASALVVEVDSCYVDTGDFVDCDGQGTGDSLDKTGLPIGTGKGEVSVTASTIDTFKVTAISTAGHHFTISQGPTSKQVHTCDAGLVSDGGGCSNGTW
ncbi:MAG TPA: prepilin-type N-terminal cleavage/methylation domain-containing protein [Thermoleophilaceae bacterium]|nr:prepilin-type N-terminal cleavage/methylation domain-containing protein [Thermoleophilaceae bacterium]